jgi:hypothetical protein
MSEIIQNTPKNIIGFLKMMYPCTLQLRLSRMKLNQCKPDIITFNLLIDSYGKKQEFK